jgi:hypothetical protein
MPNFLERELQKRLDIIANYDERIAICEEKRIAYEQAKLELETFGSVEQIKSEIDEIKALLNPVILEEKKEPIENDEIVIENGIEEKSEQPQE